MEIITLIALVVAAGCAVWCWTERNQFKEARDWWIEEARKRGQRIDDLKRDIDSLTERLNTAMLRATTAERQLLDARKNQLAERA